MLEQFVQQQRLRHKTVRLEWVMVNAGKIYSYKAICRYYKKFVKSNMEKGNLKGFMDENNSFKSNLKEYKKKCSVLFDKANAETVKEDDLTSLIYLKTVLELYFKAHPNSEYVPEMENFQKLDWQDLFTSMIN